MKGFIVYATYRVIDEKPFVFLYGRLENGEPFVTVNFYKPYFYIKESDLNHAKNLETFESEKTQMKTFEGEKTAKIFAKIPSDVPELRKLFESNAIKCYEADIRFAQRFLIDMGLKGSVDIKGDKEYQDNLLVFKEPELKPCNFFPQLKTLSIDIETSGDAKQVYAIAMASKEKETGLIVTGKEDKKTDKKIKNYVCCRTEEELLEKFLKLLHEYDPDIITGWNMIDFDLKVLQERLREYGMELAIGRGMRKCRLKLETDFMKTSKADAEGRIIIDGMQLLHDAFVKLKDYRLETAGQALAGEGKSILFKDKRKEIEEMFLNEPGKLAEYNMQDARLVLKILEKTNVLNIAIERSILTGMQIDRVSASIASFDSLYLREAKARNIACPSSSYAEKMEKVKGGFVMEPKPGIYDSVLVLDFKSLYPSIIRSFNIDPASFVAGCNGKNLIKAPNGACFRNEDGILPEVIRHLWEAREVARKRKDETARYAIKIHMNSIYGAMASPNCRFFNLAIANAITHFARQIIQAAADEIRKKGYEVIYSDTDSCFVVSSAKIPEEAEKIGEKLANEINIFYRELVKKEYKRKSYLEMQFEKCFVKFLMPKLRKAEMGAKKRYAGLSVEEGKEKISITGLEFVRGDWTELAKKFQYELLDMLFHNKGLLPFISEFVKKLQKGEFDSMLVYRKTARKNIDEYTKTTPPHIKAARKMAKLESNIIEYVMTEDGPEHILMITHKIDYEHYIKKQLKPIADSILLFLGQTFEDAVKGVKQQKLGNY